MPRRGKHEGTVTKRPNRGYWEGAVRLGGQRYYVTGRTKAECLEKIRALVARHQAGALAPPSRVILASWLRDWLAAGRPRWRPSTYRRREQALKPLIAVVGQARLDQLTPLNLWRAFDALAQAGTGQRTLELAHSTLHTALEDARRLGLIGDNPAARVPSPKAERRQAQDWTMDDMRRFLRAALEDGSPTAPMLGFMLLTGLRPSEALGLRWEDVDWQAGAVTVRRAVVWVGREWHVVPPKSKAGERSVTLPEGGKAILDRLERRLPWVFWAERPPSPHRLSDVMARLCQSAGVPHRPAHYLRHCHASLLVHLGVDVKTAQRRLGHSTAAMTLDVYSHHLPGGEAEVARMLDEALGQM